MKKTSTKIFAAAFLLSAFCALEPVFAKPQQPQTDEYIDEEPEAKTEKQKKAYEKKPKYYQEKSDHPLRDFFLGKEKYIEYDITNLGTGTLTFGNKQREATMLYNPKTQKAGIRVYYQTNFYNILFDKATRDKIASCVENYLSDFENKRLIRKSGKTRHCYGRSKCYVEWGTIKQMMNHYGNTDMFLGYTFIDKSPYFMLTVKQTKNIAEHQGEYTQKDSVEVQLYFTKAQAREFVRQLSDEVLNPIVGDYEEEAKEQLVPVTDDYEDGKGKSAQLEALKKESEETNEEAAEPEAASEEEKEALEEKSENTEAAEDEAEKNQAENSAETEASDDNEE